MIDSSHEIEPDKSGRAALLALVAFLPFMLTAALLGLAVPLGFTLLRMLLLALLTLPVRFTPLLGLAMTLLTPLTLSTT
ncbi:MAG TPA: hypothetical protein VL992_16765 [Tepidisphaeraceae bacterium]|nr:hypothetical protein [Tepidisphaeraceae bacterium]